MKSMQILVLAGLLVSAYPSAHAAQTVRGILSASADGAWREFKLESADCSGLVYAIQIQGAGCGAIFESMKLRQGVGALVELTGDVDQSGGSSSDPNLVPFEIKEFPDGD